MSTGQRHATAVGIGMPEVAICDAPEPDAFATGPRGNSAPVVVSMGLLRNRCENEVHAALRAPG